MYLSRTELEGLAEKLITKCDHADHPFNKETQIRTCSIDLRIDNVFWTLKSRKPINLGTKTIYEMSPRRLWKQHVVSPGGHIVLKPGEMILGRTYEWLNMPSEMVGKINTRSSYARLGLSTACNCDLVNPGYAGRVPIELTNSTKKKILVHPYLSLCQLFVMKVDGKVDEDYSSNRLKSKYMDDDGGPSVWWRDDLAKKVSSSITANHMSDQVATELRSTFTSIDDDGLGRLEKVLDRRSFANSEDLLNEFHKKEKRLAKLYKVRRAIALGGPFPFFGLALKAGGEQLINGTRIAVDTYIYLALTAVLILPFLYYFLGPKRKYYAINGPSEN